MRRLIEGRDIYTNLHMELYQIKHFVAVVEAGGFTKGAERVAVSQPAISASIAKLEAELNVNCLSGGTRKWWRRQREHDCLSSEKQFCRRAMPPKKR